MEHIEAYQDYKVFKNSLDTELKNQAEGFVRTGYLLKIARDTDILKESGYQTVAEFAQAEYGLAKDVVSRYIAINDKFAKGGYSDLLEERFQGYGIAKLQEMLTLPVEVVEVLDKSMTRAAIQEVKKVVQAEEAIQPLEVMMEVKEVDLDRYTDFQKAMYQHFKVERESFLLMAAVLDAYKEKGNQSSLQEEMLDILAPSGVDVIKTRISGVGTIMVAIKGIEQPVEVVNIREAMKTQLEWEEVLSQLFVVFSPLTPESTHKELWEYLYQEPFEEEKKVEETKVEEVEVAPVQPIEEPQEEKAEWTKPSIQGPKELPEEQQEEECETRKEQDESQEEQVEGQTNLTDDFPQYLPDRIEELKEKIIDMVEQKVVRRVEWSKGGKPFVGGIDACIESATEVVALLKELKIEIENKTT